MIRVLVVDDSRVVRKAIKALLENNPGLRVVGMARNGQEAVEMAAKLKPDVITMDVNMPILGGFEATRLIMEHNPTPIVVVTASMDKEESRVSFKAIEAGALTVVAKPDATSARALAISQKELVDAVRLMSQVKVIHHWRRKPKVKRLSMPSIKRKTDKSIIAIGASTGGPSALATILRQLPPELKIPVVVVQHISTGFGIALAEWLDKECPLPVRVARRNEKLKPGTVVLAPDQCHLGIDEKGETFFSHNVSYNHHCPSINFLFSTIAKNYQWSAIGVILTGMGNDGAEGIKLIKQSGGFTIAQDQDSSAVFGMPKAAISTGAVDTVLPLDKIAKAILKAL
jgi:two-component system chemotaxis response regulator CheB